MTSDSLVQAAPGRDNRWRRLLLALVLTMAAVVLPTAASEAQTTSADCGATVVVEDRCLSVDGQATLCDGQACISFVEESVPVCPGASIVLTLDPLTCQLTQAASQNGPGCPEGSRGEADQCHILLAAGVNGCLDTFTFVDSNGNCRRPVNNAQGAFFCDIGAQLSGRDCISIIDPVPSPCPSGTTRFDGACWQMNGLTAPESCGGHSVPGTVTLASGLCQVPLAIPTGPASCADGGVYFEHPSYVLVDEGGQLQGQGPVEAACVDDSASVGLGIRFCFFPGDDFEWTNSSTAQEASCSRYEEPTVSLCPAGFSMDDLAGGLCRRFVAPVNNACTSGTLESNPLGTWCAITADFDQIECPAGTGLDPELVLVRCVATRPWQSAALCSSGRQALLLPSDSPEFGLSYGCFAQLGPQPDTCNGQGTLDDCFEILEPAAVPCAATSGCVELGLSCQGKTITINMNLGASGMGTAGDDVILGTPGPDMIDAGDGNDTVCAEGGADVVVGGEGDDTIFGGDGRDILRGGPGADFIEGQAGNDRLLGGIDGDTINGGTGDDYIGGFGGADTIDGGPGNETIFGGFGADVINAGPGDDKVFGLVGNDVINGGPGNDELNGDRGNDTINGGAGNDVIRGGNANDVLDGGDGDDSVNGGRADDQLSGGDGTNDTCVGNKQINGDTADGTCELIFGVP